MPEHAICALEAPDDVGTRAYISSPRRDITLRAFHICVPQCSCELKGCRVSCLFHGYPGKYRSATARCGLRPMTCMMQPRYRLMALAQPPSTSLVMRSQKPPTAIIILCTRRHTKGSDVSTMLRMSETSRRKMHSTTARPGTQPIPFLPAL